MGERVRITEVGPRDGLQNEPGVIPTPQKARLIELCAQTGVDEIEATSFVSPKWVPQLGDASELFELLDHPLAEGGGRGWYSALVPNERGLAAALEVNQRAGTRVIQKVSVFAAASETFSARNINATIEESIARFVPVVRVAHERGILVRGYISCVIACPFEGVIAPARVAHVAQRLLEIGVDEIDLGDTIGAGTAESVREMLRHVLRELGSWANSTTIDEPRLTLHLHDTFGRASACVKAALDLGVRSFDASVAGLGGCPYASTPGKRAPGNISTDTLVRTIHNAGFSTGVDLDKLAIAASFAQTIVNDARAHARASTGTPQPPGAAS